MGPTEAHLALGDQPLFAALEGGAELADILALARPFHLPAGAVLFRQGEPADGLYVLTEGQVAIHARIPGDTRGELGVLGPGAMLGEIALIDRGARSAGAEARTEVSGWFVSERLFRTLRVARRPSARKVMERICAVVCERIRARVESLTRAMPPPAPPWTPGVPLPEAAPPPVPGEIAGSLLRKLPFFARFEPDDRVALLALGKVITANRGVLLWSQGDAPSRCCVPLRGALRITVEREGGAEPCMVIGPGQLAGGVALTDGLPQPTRCEVSEPAWLFTADVQRLREAAAGPSNLSLELFDAVADSLVERLRVVTRAVARLAAQGRMRPWG